MDTYFIPVRFKKSKRLKPLQDVLRARRPRGNSFCDFAVVVLRAEDFRRSWLVTASKPSEVEMDGDNKMRVWCNLNCKGPADRTVPLIRSSRLLRARSLRTLS